MMMEPRCNLCPRNCGADRQTKIGFCGVGEQITVARAALHFWEEPCISGERGSGTVFFSGCNLQCVYCQNFEISTGKKGALISVARLREIFFELIDRGAENINLVTPSHFVPQIARALQGGLPVPVIYNCGGYEKPETLQMLDGLVDVYLPDLKYSDARLAEKYSRAPDYPAVAVAAVREMYRQVGSQVFDRRGMLIRGVQLRHLVLPGNAENTYGVMDLFTRLFPRGDVGFSLMSQYTPTPLCGKFPALCRRLTAEEYENAVNYMYLCGIENGFVQELSSAKEEYTPDFDLTGVFCP